MRVSAPSAKSTRATSADWVELQVLITETDVSEQNLIRSQSVQSEYRHGDQLTEFDLEPADEEILESAADELSQHVYEELSYRERILGDLYPFELVANYGKWVLRRRTTETAIENAAHETYVCCLLITAMHSDLLPIVSTHDLFKRSAEVMQIESYLTAAEILGGNAFWFGYPRPDHSNMLTALQDLVKKMGLGQVPERVPDGVASNANDGTVDIVAWRHFLDGLPSAIVAYGQVASGRYWERKSVRNFIDGHFLAWFSKKPSHKHIELLFIPSLQHHKHQDKSSEDYWDAVREEARVREMDLGVVIDRLRLTELMAAAWANGRYKVQELPEYFNEVNTWTQKALVYAAGR